MDHHVHFLATAAAALSVDVSRARDVPGVLAALRAGAPPRGWVRAWGYDDGLLDDGRHPTAAELERALPGRPVVLHHRTGHAAVVSAAAAAEIGGPAGLLVDRHDLLARVPKLPARRLGEAAARVSRTWQSRGIAAFEDATHTNDLAALELFDAWTGDGTVVQAVTCMVSGDMVSGDTVSGEMACGAVTPVPDRVGAVLVGPVKLMPGADLAGRVRRARAAGAVVALHVTDIQELEDALDALEAAPPPDGGSDRIEHNSLSLPEQVARLARLPVRVVVNPSFLVHRAAKYRRQLAPVEMPWLVRIRSLVDAGVEVRAGSDSPVTPADPREGMAAATAHPFTPDESVSALQARELYDPWSVSPSRSAR